MTEMPASVRNKCILLPENAIDPKKFEARPSGRSPVQPLRACFLGRFVPYKGPQMLLNAAAEAIRNGKLVINMVGAGPLDEELRAQVLLLGISEGVTFHGWVPHERVGEILGACDLLTFPSVREFGGGVVLEAMAQGVVPVIVDYGGPAELVDNETAFTIPLGSHDDIEDRLKRLLDDIIADPDQLIAMSKNGMSRVARYFTWERKAEQVIEVYDWVLGRRSIKPLPFPSGRDGQSDHSKAGPYSVAD